MELEETLTLNGGHTMHYTDGVLYNFILGTYIVLLTIVTVINSI